jgi:hypothetical protein
MFDTHQLQQHPKQQQQQQQVKMEPKMIKALHQPEVSIKYA